MTDLRIVLIGYRGTGKSSIAQCIGEMSGRQVFDTDDAIENFTRKKIPEIFSESGEDHFREIESYIISHIPESAGIISCGGGAVLRPENIRHLRRNSLIYLLTADPKTIAERITESSRPPLTDLPLIDEIRTIYAERLPLYRSAADCIIETDSSSIDEISANIIRKHENGCGDRKTRDSFSKWILQTRIPQSEKNRISHLSSQPYIGLYGIAGNPCMHSKSPAVWNHLFRELGMPAHYTWFECPDIGRLMKAARDSGVKGLSVTIPHKETIIPFLDEIRNDASTLGAVNTVQFTDRKAIGYNTDWKGIYRPLEGVQDEIAIILGAGGAAAAAVYATIMRGYKPIILNRTVERAEALALRFGGVAGPLSKIGEYDADLLINTTPIGMGDDTRTPIPVEYLKPGMRVFDLVYTPAETPLIRAALERGCSIIPGTEMFIHQLVEQFRILTGVDISVDHVRRLLL